MKKDSEDLQLLREIGLRIGMLRQSMRMSQAELGASMGLTRAAMASIESGRQGVYLDQLLSVALALGVNLNGILPESSQLGKSFIGFKPPEEWKRPTPAERLAQFFRESSAKTGSYLGSHEDEAPSNRPKYPTGRKTRRKAK